MVLIIERIDLGCASNPMRVLISLTAAYDVVEPDHPILDYLDEVIPF